MSDWIQVKGIVKQGYGVASGLGGDPRFPQGTIRLQLPFFEARGLKLDEYFPGTINVSIAPHAYTIKQAKHTFKTVKWSPNSPAEDFSFFDCRLLLSTGQRLNGLIYYPHPETKPEHFQSADVLEIITTPIESLQYGDALTLEVDRHQIAIA